MQHESEQVTKFLLRRISQTDYRIAMRSMSGSLRPSIPAKNSGLTKILSHHSGHLIIERVLPFLSDFELLELEKELGEREDLLEGLNAALPSIVWRLRGKRNQQELRISNDFSNYCAAVRENLNQRALTWNDIDFN